MSRISFFTLLIFDSTNCLLLFFTSVAFDTTSSFRLFFILTAFVLNSLNNPLKFLIIQSTKNTKTAKKTKHQKQNPILFSHGHMFSITDLMLLFQ